MSFQAMAWAASQTTGAPARKALLMAIANYADEKGVCWPSRETLADDSEQSVDSVDRHLRELEASGFIKRSKREGRRSDGGEQSRLITLLFDRERLKNDLVFNRTGEHNLSGPQPQIAADPSAANCGYLGRTMRPSSAANCGPNLSEEPITEPTPLAPEGDLGVSSPEDEISKTAQARFDRLRNAWPSDPTINWDRVGGVFFALNAADQDNAARIASRYVGFCREAGRKLKAPENWLRQEGWKGFIDEERRAQEAIGVAKRKVFVREGSEAWRAWEKHFAGQGKRMRLAEYVKAEQARGWYLDTLFPPKEPPS